MKTYFDFMKPLISASRVLQKVDKEYIFTDIIHQRNKLYGIVATRFPDLPNE